MLKYASFHWPRTRLFVQPRVFPVSYIVTNDDGVDAPGIAALAKAVDDEGVVVAPKSHMSGCGHQTTTAEPIHVEKRNERTYAVNGTPADCARIALYHIAPEPAWVLSGINEGGNLGADVYQSGTVAAVREAAFLGIPGIAISHYKKRGLEINWDRAARWTKAILEDLFERPLESRTFWNVNLPHLEPHDADPEVVFCGLCREPLPVHFRIEGEHFHYTGEYAERTRTPGADVELCLAGKITITSVPL